MTKRPYTLGHAGLDHARHHIAYANSTVPRGERWAMGAALVNSYRRIIRGREDACKGKYRGEAALNRGGLTRQLWVVEKPGSTGLQQGTVVKRAALAQRLESDCGAVFREATVPTVGSVAKELLSMAKTIRHVHHPMQYSSGTQRACAEGAMLHSGARVILMIDLGNAFHQVRVTEVADILREVFMVKGWTARRMANLFSMRGRESPERCMYRGNPVCTALFDIRTLWCVERLGRLCEANGLVLTMHADDLCISSGAWTHFSKGFRRSVCRIIRECGLRVDPCDFRVRAVDARKLGRCDITGIAVGFDGVTRAPYVRTLHRRRVLRGDA